MEPGVYENFKCAVVSLPTRIPGSESAEEQMQNFDERSQQERQAVTDWTVYSMNITRGNLDRDEDPNDLRTHVGWREEPAKTWMSSTEQQPFVCSQGHSEKDEETTPRTAATLPKYPYPNLSLPHPSLTLDFRMSVTLNPRISVGPTPFGHRNWISFVGGNWSGSWGDGTVLPGGQDSQLIIPDGSARLETSYLLQTHDEPPAHIAIKTHGWRTGPPEILAQLADPNLADEIDPNSYKFRLFIEMETGDERYRDKVNCGMWVGSGMRKGSEVIYDAYRIS